MKARYIAPIAVELLVREAQSLTGYPDGDHRTTRLYAIHDELARLGARDKVLDMVAPDPVHTVRGEVIGDPDGPYPDGVPYGTTHDMDCPGCQDIPFLASPRSETYWAS